MGPFRAYDSSSTSGAGLGGRGTGIGGGAIRAVDLAARRVLSDWMSEVLPTIGLFDACLWLTVRNFDRYIQTTRIARKDYTLAFIACFWIAAKLDGTNGSIGPTKELLAKFDLPFNLSLVLQCESTVLNLLQFKVLVPTAFDFIGRYLAILTAPPRVSHASHYCAERALVETVGFESPPSRLAAASVLIGLLATHPSSASLRCTIDSLLDETACELPKAIEIWDRALAADTGYTARSLLPLVSIIAEIAISGSPSRVKAKYGTKAYGSITSIFEPRSGMVDGGAIK
jgi:hypothetical protein